MGGFLVIRSTARQFNIFGESSKAVGLLWTAPTLRHQSAIGWTADVQAAAGALGQQVHVEKASSERDIDAAFAAFVQARVDAFFVAGDPLFTSRRVQLVVLAARHGAMSLTIKSRVRAMGIRDRPISPGLPWQNPYAELSLPKSQIRA
jgi:hypothetical protein